MYQTLNKYLVKTSGKVDSKETLLLIHGWGMNSQVWEPVREKLEENYKIITVDLPGHGFNYTVKAINMQDIAELIIQQMPQKCHIIGWSLGGLIAQLLAQRVPDQIQSMTLVATTPKFSQSQANDEKCWQHAMSHEILDNFAEQLKTDTLATLKKFVALQFMGVKESKGIQRGLIRKITEPQKTGQKWGGVLSTGINNTSIVSIPDQEALDLGLRMLKEADFRKSAINVPEHWVFGGRDRLIPMEVINDLKYLRPNAQITLLENAGHAPFMTHPDEFLAHIMSVIDNQPDGL